MDLIEKITNGAKIVFLSALLVMGTQNEIKKQSKIERKTYESKVMYDINSNGVPDIVRQDIPIIGTMAGLYPGIGYARAHEFHRPTNEEIKEYQSE